MATGQTILDAMELLNQELQLQSGEADVTRGLIAVNLAQDAFESRLAKFPLAYGDTVGTVTTTASTETTTYPTGLLRLDRLQFISATTSLPVGPDLTRHPFAGGKRLSWPGYLFASGSGTGRPVGYWADGRKIYWDPLPDATHTVRWYGLQAQTDLTASGTLAYPDATILPFASFATSLMKVGVGDSASDVASLSAATFDPLIETLSNFNRDGALPLRYTRTHTT